MMNPFPFLVTRKYRSHHGFLFLAVLFIAIVLGVVRTIARDDTPTSDVPSQTWGSIVIETPSDSPINGGEEPGEVTDKQGIAVGEPDPSSGVVIPPPEVQEKPLPAEFNLAVPFSSQAPTGNWDALHEDACEEASIYMVHEYFAGVGEGKVDPAAADPVITDLVHYGEENLGHGLSITAAQTVALIEAYYPDMEAEVLENPSVDDLKRLLSDGYPVIVPALGRELGNPNFTGEGPLYHMLVLRGYDATHFITNDPGTRLGQNYSYTYDVMMAAIADWNNGDPANGASRVIVVRPINQ